MSLLLSTDLGEWVYLLVPISRLDSLLFICIIFIPTDTEHPPSEGMRYHWISTQCVQHDVFTVLLSAGFVAIVVYSYGAKFDIIAPDDGLFVKDCNVGYGVCHGVYFGHKNNSQLESLITLLTNPVIDSRTQHCGDHGDITKFGITCSPSESHIFPWVCVNNAGVSYIPLCFSTGWSSAHSGGR